MIGRSLSRVRARLALWVWSSQVGLTRLRGKDADALAEDFRSQARLMPLRWTERLRDAMRPRWLRLRRSGDDA